LFPFHRVSQGVALPFLTTLHMPQSSRRRHEVVHRVFLIGCEALNSSRDGLVVSHVSFLPNHFLVRVLEDVARRMN